jgi:hypothetical protein
LFPEISDFADERFIDRLADANAGAAAGTSQLWILGNSAQREETLILAMPTYDGPLERLAGIQKHDASQTHYGFGCRVWPLNSANWPHPRGI